MVNTEPKAPIRIAIVEDDLSFRKLLVSTLQADPDHAAEFVAARRDELESAMALTLARMKAVLEA